MSIYAKKSFQIEIISIICKTKITGKPMENLSFLVLCLNVYIPAIAPILPPIIAKTSNVCSGILHFPYLAFRLSIYIARNAIKFITTK